MLPNAAFQSGYIPAIPRGSHADTGRRKSLAKCRVIPGHRGSLAGLFRLKAVNRRSGPGKRRIPEIPAHMLDHRLLRARQRRVTRHPRPPPPPSRLCSPRNMASLDVGNRMPYGAYCKTDYCFILVVLMRLLVWNLVFTQVWWL
ncbi:hypothetical protein AAFF_G00104430 [Aldrovandia affinis]|uniref:Uncharacterized protein n=1 Tax=Aldrovandia affinis TaxID=143900 RepID=A0AAD7T1X2_9TELE|nr:hypothetical protein AAFF_G00104430 [Aldrovandia affinis]